MTSVLAAAVQLSSTPESITIHDGNQRHRGRQLFLHVSVFSIATPAGVLDRRKQTSGGRGSPLTSKHCRREFASPFTFEPNAINMMGFLSKAKASKQPVRFRRALRFTRRKVAEQIAFTIQRYRDTVFLNRSLNRRQQRKQRRYLGCR